MKNEIQLMKVQLEEQIRHQMNYVLFSRIIHGVWLVPMFDAKLHLNQNLESLALRESCDAH